MNDLSIDRLSQAISHIDPALRTMLDCLVNPMPLQQWEDAIDDLSSWLQEFGHQENPHQYEHVFSDGVYYRQMTKAEGEVGIGARHRNEHLNLMISGKQILFTHEGPIVMQGYCVFNGASGSRKATLTLTPVVFANVFANPDNCRDIQELERRLALSEEPERIGV